MLLPDTGRAMRAIHLLTAADRYGLDSEAIRKQVGIRRHDIDDPDKRIPSTRILGIWDLLAAQVSDPDLGLDIGTHGDVRDGGVLGYAVMHSTNAGRALRRITRFSRLISTRFDFALVEGSETWRLEGRRPPETPGFRPPIDQVTSGIVTVLRQITHRQIDPVVVEFSYQQPDDLSLLREVFRSDLRFGAPRGALVFRTQDMHLEVVDAEVKLAEYLDRLAEQELAALPSSDTYARQTARTIWHHLSEGQPTLDDVAREIGVSSRTLQRRLREEGTSFAQVIEDLRKQMAPKLLRDESLAVYEVAYLLGYAEPSAFFRAFRRWHGNSPAEHRQMAS